MAENLGANFTIDITNLKAGLAAANRAIRESESEFKAAAAGMGDWTKSQEGLEKKIATLNKTAEIQSAKVAALKQEYDRLISEGLDPTSAKAVQLRTQINNETAALNKSNAEIAKNTAALEAMQAESGDAASKTETLTQKVERQESELKDLKARYTEVAAAQGKNSDEAKELAGKIEDLSGELKDNKSKLKEASDAADDLDKSFEDAEKGGVSSFTVALGNLAANAITSVINKMKELVSNTIEVGKNFDSSMSKVQAVSGASGEELELLRDKAKEMGASTKFSASEAADAFNYMAMAGWKTEDMLGGIEGVLNLAAASGSDLATTSDIVTDALTAMGYSAGDAGRLADVMAAASSNANTNVEMMGQTFKYAAPIVGALGYNMEDTAVAIGLMANAGIKADQAGTSLRSILTRLSAPPKECADAMNALGISMTDSNGEMKSLDQVMQDLRGAFDGLSETEQTAYAKHIAGQEAMSGLLAIVNAAPEDFNKLTAAVESSEGAAEEMAKTMQDNLGGDLTELGSKFEGVQIALYEKFEPALRAGVDALSKLLDAVDFVVDHSTEFTAALAAMGAGIAAYVAYTTAIKVMKEGWASLAIVQKAVTAAQWLMNAAMTANPIGLIIAAVAALVAAFVVLWKKSEGFRNFFIGMWEKIKEVAGAVWQAITGFFSSAWETIQSVWSAVAGWFSETVIEPIKEFFSAVVDFFTEAFDTIAGFAQSCWDTIKAVWSVVVDWFKAIIDPIVNFFTTAFEIIFQLAEGCWNAIKLIWTAVSGWFKSNIIDPIVNFFTTLWNTIKTAAQTAWNGIKAIWSIVSGWFNTYIIQPITNFFTGLWNGIKTAAQNAWNGIKSIWSIVSGWFNNTIIAPIKNFFTGMWNSVKSGASAAWNGIKSVFGGVADWFKNIFSNAWQKVKNVFSTGGKVFDGIKDGITKAFKTVVNAIIKGINKVISIPFNAINGILDKIRNVSILGAHPFKNLISRFDVPQIPLLAKGGVVKRATQAVIGEDGAEAVVPLERNTGWIDMLAEKLAEKTGGGVVVNQTNNYAQAHSRYEIYKSQQATAAAVKLALMR